MWPTMTSSDVGQASLELLSTCRRVLVSSAISKPFPSLEEEEEESTHRREVETELAMRSGFGVTLMVELPNNRVPNQIA